ncbi:MAG: thiamine pyrophosphate-dependent enzyme, partial [Terriglobia bacterium]
TTASKTAFQNPKVSFININVAAFDASKHAALAVVADARTALDELTQTLKAYCVEPAYTARLDQFRTEWSQEVKRICNPHHDLPVTQGEVIGLLNAFTGPRDVVVSAAGSLPGDLHKLWRSRDAKGYHVEYGYSTMGYEIAGGLGVKMADPEREVYVLVGDGSYLMMAQEIVTSLQEGCKLNVIVLDNHGFSSIGGLSRACGSGGFGTEYRYRRDGELNGDVLAVDFVANACSLGASAIKATTREELASALDAARSCTRTAVIVIEVDAGQRVPGYESWWDVAVSEVSEMESVRTARAEYIRAKKRERYFL